MAADGDPTAEGAHDGGGEDLTPAHPPASPELASIHARAEVIAHDLGNVLGGIAGFAELGCLDAADPVASAQNFNLILQAIERARALVAQIKTISGVDAATTPVTGAENRLSLPSQRGEGDSGSRLGSSVGRAVD